MHAARLTFLYPSLFRTARLGEPVVTRVGRAGTARSKFASVVSRHALANGEATFTTTPTTPSTYAKRHGKAVEPLPLHSVPKSAPASRPGRSERGGAEGKTGDKQAAAAAKGANKDGGKTEVIKSAAKASSTEAETVPTKTSDVRSPPPKASQGKHDAQPDPPLARTETDATPNPDASLGTASAMDAILHMSTPSSSTTTPPAPDSTAVDMSPQKSSTPSPPHLVPPMYVHHFDSYSLVKRLEEGGWTRVQAIHVMKAMRGLLATNLDAAQAGLVSRRDVDNESYLFRAACSELSAEVRNNRRVADEGMRQQRTLLQHEVDILAQRLNQELLSLGDNVKGLFNDRRMAVREEQKAGESAIQQLNYKISVMLNSDAKSEIEGVRWVLIRRSVLGIIFMAVLTLASLRYASYLGHERQKQEVEQAARDADALREAERNLGKRDDAAAPDAVHILSAS